MKTDIKQVKVFAAKWWNPLFWLLVVIAPVLGPVLGIILGGVYGAFCGLLIGYEKGLNEAGNKLNKFLATLP